MKSHVKVAKDFSQIVIKVKLVVVKPSFQGISYIFV
jgi:hypothetical protein